MMTEQNVHRLHRASLMGARLNLNCCRDLLVGFGRWLLFNCVLRCAPVELRRGFRR